METVPIRYYLDNHISKAVVIQLIRRGIDVVHCDDVGMAKASDMEHLEYATQLGRVVVSQDRDFAELHFEWEQLGKQHKGIMMVPSLLQGQAQIAYIVPRLIEYHDLATVGAAGPQNDIVNQLIWL